MAVGVDLAMQSAGSADLSLDGPGLAEHLLRDVASGKDVVLLVSPSCGEAVLDHAKLALEGRRDRVVRVSGAGDGAGDKGAGTGGLGLPALLRQLAQYAEHPSSEAGQAPERDIEVLTRLGPSCDRIILMVDHADALESGALRAVELACRTGGLCLVFAGSPRLLTILEDVPVLRGRLLRGVRYTAMTEPSDPLEADPKVLEPVAPRSRRVAGRVVGAAGMAVLGVLGIMTVRAFVPAMTETSAPAMLAPIAASGPAPLAEASADANPGGEAELAPAAPALVPVVAPAADPAPIQKIRPTKHQLDHAGRAVRTAAHTAPASRNVAEKESSAGDFIGSFSPGTDGVRAFKFRP